MKIETFQAKPENLKTEILGVFLYKEKKLPGYLGNIDKKLNNQITDFLKNKTFEGELNETFLITTFGKVPARYVLLIGIGERKKFNTDNLRQASATGAIYARDSERKEISFYLEKSMAKKEHAQAVSEGVVLGLYKFDKYQTKKKDKKRLKVVKVACQSNLKEVKKAVEIGQKLANAVNYARNLENLPANIATPTYLANEAKKLSKLGIKVTIIGKDEMKKLGMNLILGVSAGSSQEPKLVILEYKGGKKGPIALVGKGVTFDAGGLDLKPEKYMWNMHYDKCGALTVFGIIRAAAELKLPVHLVGLTPFTENLAGGSAQKPADIVKGYSGKTVEIINTDAEGRLILADALAYSKKFKPKAIIDFATLTGACVVALGHYAAGLIGDDKKLIEKIKKASEKTAEKVWELPLWDEYREQMKSEVADVKNLGEGGAGTITAAAFLENFIPEKTSWAHLDIAGTAYVEEIKNPKTYASKGATGHGIRLITQVLSEW